MSGLIETYRGVVFPWEVDMVGHLTVAYYFERLEDATLGLLDAIGLGADYMERERHACLTVDCYVRYVPRPVRGAPGRRGPAPGPAAGRPARAGEGDARRGSARLR